MRNEAELIAAARRNANCAAVFAPECRAGDITIVEVIRRRRAGSGLPHEGCYETGAMAEISNLYGGPRLVQSRGFANGDPRPSADKALRRFLASIDALDTCKNGGGA